MPESGGIHQGPDSIGGLNMFSYYFQHSALSGGSSLRERACAMRVSGPLPLALRELKLIVNVIVIVKGRDTENILKLYCTEGP